MHSYQTTWVHMQYSYTPKYVYIHTHKHTKKTHSFRHIYTAIRIFRYTTCDAATHLNTYTYTHKHTHQKHFFVHIYTPIRVFRYTQDFLRQHFLFFFCLVLHACIHQSASAAIRMSSDEKVFSCRVGCFAYTPISEFQRTHDFWHRRGYDCAPVSCTYDRTC